jgi:hypothetical protein
MTPLEVAHYVPHPAIVLTGCQAWPPARTSDRCPVCGGGVRPDEHTTYCAVCDSMSPRNEARVRAQLLGVRSRDAQDEAAKHARESMAKRAKGGLTEGERRALWNGYRGGIKAENPEPTNRAKLARDWLTERGMAPDWSIVIDSKGNRVGRHDPAIVYDRRGNPVDYLPDPDAETDPA